MTLSEARILICAMLTMVPQMFLHSVCPPLSLRGWKEDAPLSLSHTMIQSSTLLRKEQINIDSSNC